jgi:hypothetical protein
MFTDRKKEAAKDFKWHFGDSMCVQRKGNIVFRNPKNTVPANVNQPFFNWAWSYNLCWLMGHWQVTAKVTLGAIHGSL